MARAKGRHWVALWLVAFLVTTWLVYARRWRGGAQAQRPERSGLQARGAALSDRHGTPLAVTQETYHVGIAPNELRDPTADGALISRRLGLTAGAWQLALRRRYAYFAGPDNALQGQPPPRVLGGPPGPGVNPLFP